MDRKLKSSEEDRQLLKKELRQNKNENLDNFFNLARAAQEKLQLIINKAETTDKEREKHMQKDTEIMKNCMRP